MLRFVSLAAIALALTAISAIADDSLSTISEKSGFQKTGRYDEVISLCAAFQKAFPKEVVATEFGRTPDTAAAKGDGRDHHPNAFTIWMAGGGAKPGLLYGTSDDLGKDVAENPVTVHDLHATVLHLLGLDHSKLSYRFGGRDVTLADVHGKVVNALVA